MGPAIGSTAFTVGNDVHDLFLSKNIKYKAAFEAIVENRWHCSLYRLATIEFETIGVKNVYGGDFCTFSDTERFYSYRRDGVQTGRQAHLIWINE